MSVPMPICNTMRFSAMAGSSYAAAAAIRRSTPIRRSATTLRSPGPTLRSPLARRSGAPLLPRMILLPGAVRRSPAVLRSASRRSATFLRSAAPSLRSAFVRLSFSLLFLSSSAFILLSRLLRGNVMRARVLQERVVGNRREWREVAVGDPFRPGRLADVIRNRAQRQIDDRARVGRDVGGRGVHEIAVEHQDGAGLAGRRDDSGGGDQP